MCVLHFYLSSFLFNKFFLKYFIFKASSCFDACSMLKSYIVLLHTCNLILYAKVFNYLFTREVCQEKKGKDKYSPGVTNQKISSDKAKTMCTFVHLKM